MFIAIISDIHNNTTNLKKVLDYCRRENIRKIICCGDLASKETLDFLCDNFAGDIFYTFGNMDEEQINIETNKHKNNNTFKYRNAKIFKDYGKLEIENNPVKSNDHGARKIAFVHYPNVANELCKTEKYDFVFHGHTHKPWVASVKTTADQRLKEKCTILNPGNVAGEIYPPTFAIWNTKNDDFKLIRIHELK